MKYTYHAHASSYYILVLATYSIFTNIIMYTL